jgi:hypothetical protein
MSTISREKDVTGYWELSGTSMAVSDRAEGLDVSEQGAAD